jgi:hypothetical protein
MSETALEAAARQQEHGLQRGGPTAAPRFAVSAAWMAGGDIRPPSRGRGTLSVSPDALVFAASGGTQVVHLERRVTVATGLLCPPWSNTFLLLRDKTVFARVGASALSRRRLRRALREIGVAVDTALSWHAPPIQSSALP